MGGSLRILKITGTWRFRLGYSKGAAIKTTEQSVCSAGEKQASSCLSGPLLDLALKISSSF